MPPRRRSTSQPRRRSTLPAKAAPRAEETTKARRVRTPAQTAGVPVDVVPKPAPKPPSTMGRFMLLMMYCHGPFNFHGLKLPLQLSIGSSYERAYRHFRNNHSIPLNIVAHLLGLLLSPQTRFVVSSAPYVAADGYTYLDLVETQGTVLHS